MPPHLIQIFLFLNMGSSSSSETADSIESDKTENFGLLNISNGISGGYNALEIITFVLVVMAAIVFLKIFCTRRRKKRMDEIQKRLQGISLPELFKFFLNFNNIISTHR